MSDVSILNPFSFGPHLVAKPNTNGYIHGGGGDPQADQEAKVGAALAAGLGLAIGLALAAKMRNDQAAADKEKQQEAAIASYQSNVRIKKNPCAQYACGVPGSKYRGGAHGCTSIPKGDGLDSHHTPADAASPLPTNMGPAIQMDPADHALTASNSQSGPGSLGYIASQQTAIDSGNFMGAVQMDVADVQSKFPDGKYDAALDQMKLYANCLKANGIVK